MLVEVSNFPNTSSTCSAATNWLRMVVSRLSHSNSRKLHAASSNFDCPWQRAKHFTSISHYGTEETPKENSPNEEVPGATHQHQQGGKTMIAAVPSILIINRWLSHCLNYLMPHSGASWASPKAVDDGAGVVTCLAVASRACIGAFMHAAECCREDV